MIYYTQVTSHLTTLKISEPTTVRSTTVGFPESSTPRFPEASTPRLPESSTPPGSTTKEPEPPRRGCPPLRIPVYGGHHGQRMFHEGDKVVFHCPHGTVLAGPHWIVCLEGEWSGPVPRCLGKFNNFTHFERVFKCRV